MNNKKQPFLNNVVIITGASSGIGRQLALQLADLGAWLSLAARNTKNLENVAKQCLQRGGKALVVPTDVSEQSQCQNLIESTVKAYGRIDTLINNTGIGSSARFDELRDISFFEKVIQVNFYGSVYCTYHALPYLKETQGRLVGISSLAGKIARPESSSYTASKHAMGGFFDALRIELAENGVSVTVIYPGWVTTGISSRAIGADGQPLGKVFDIEEGAMPVETCARLIVQAITKRKREVVMTLQGKVGLWLKLIAPGWVDQVAQKN